MQVSRRGFLRALGIGVAVAPVAAVASRLPEWQEDNVSQAVESQQSNELAYEIARRAKTLKRDMEEALLKDALRDAWNNGGSPDCIIVDPDAMTELVRLV